MIYILIGGIGSGKSLSMCREISLRKNICYANFRVKYRNTRLITQDDMIIPELSKTGKISGYSVNWGFFDKIAAKHKNFDLFIDEFHDIMNSRRSVSNKNIALSSWLAQVRKILGNMKDHHLFVATQTLRKVDVNIQDLCHFVVAHDSREIDMNLLKPFAEYDPKFKKALIVRRTIYGSGKANDGVYSYMHGINVIYQDSFIGNQYFNKYDSYEIINR